MNCLESSECAIAKRKDPVPPTHMGGPIAGNAHHDLSYKKK